MSYQWLRRLLFALDPERAHGVSLQALKLLQNSPFAVNYSAKIPPCPRQVMGLHFANPVGLAAGLDKNGDCIAALASLGFGFIEIGTVTPYPQPGNPKPRLFRLPEQQALINRLGFNNKGVDYLVKKVVKSNFKGVLGINIGKNRDTSINEAVNDYKFCFEKVYAHASYVTINISSPNTPGLRDLQYGEHLIQLVAELKQQQKRLADQHQRYVPIALKIAPDVDDNALAMIARLSSEQHLDALIATNTTISRTGVEHINEAGGLSGAPLFHQSLAVVKKLHQLLQGQLPIIGCGGIVNPDHALAMINTGASLIQLYTGLIYQGPGLIKAIVKKLDSFGLCHPDDD